MIGMLERGLIELLLQFFSVDDLAYLRDPRTAAVIVGAMVAISGAWLGTYLILRKMSMTSDAISHTVLLGIVVAFLVMTGLLGMEPDISSPLLVLGAALAGVATVLLTELIFRSGLVKEDAALGLAFPLLFAIAVLLISRYVEDVHLDSDAVILGEIGLVWTDTTSYCLENCDEITITPDSPLAESGRQCVNCESEGISPRDPNAVFEDICTNCGTFTAAQAWANRYIDEQPQIVQFPRAITIMGLITLLNIAFVLLLYKELKLATFDHALAATLGFRPVMLNYALMTLVSVTAVGAFDAVGSILMVAFFVIPAATAYLLTDRLWHMLLISPLVGVLAVYTGYDFSRGDLWGVFQVRDILEILDRTIGLDGYTEWNTSPSAAMVLMMFVYFLLAWALSPRYGLLAGMLRRWRQRRTFATLMLLGHIANHEGTEVAGEELRIKTLFIHLNWTPRHMNEVLGRAKRHQLIRIRGDIVTLTAKGRGLLQTFEEKNLALARRKMIGVGD